MAQKSGRNFWRILHSMLVTAALMIAITAPALAQLPVVSVRATIPTAYEQGQVAGEFTASRTGSTVNSLRVYFTLGGTATPGPFNVYPPIGDYGAPPNLFVDIPAGQSMVTVPLTPNNDTYAECSETVIVTLPIVIPQTYDINPNFGSATVTIIDNDRVVTVQASTPNASEVGPTPGAFTISRTGCNSDDLVVRYTMSGTAGNGVDFQALSGSATIPAGSSSVNIPVVPVQDSYVESSETAVLTLTANAAYTVGSSSTATVTIADKPYVTVAATDASARSYPTIDTGTFTITRTGATTSALLVNLTMGGGAQAGVHYKALPSTTTIPAGASSTTLIVEPMDPGYPDCPRTVTLAIAAPSDGSYLSNSVAANVSIAINYRRLGFQVSPKGYNYSPPYNPLPDYSLPGTFNEGDPITIRVDVQGCCEGGYPPPTYYPDIRYSIQGSAVNGTDYYTGSSGTPLSGVLQIQQHLPTVYGNANYSGIINVTTVKNPAVTGDKTVTLQFLTDPNYIISNIQGYQGWYSGTFTFTIKDTDVSTISIQATTPTAYEAGQRPGVFTISRTAPLTNAVTVSYVLGGNASNGADFTTVPGTVTIPAGSASATINVSPIDDTLVEGDETVSLVLQPPNCSAPATCYSLGTPVSATVTIIDNDIALHISTTALPGGQTGVAYNQPLNATGGTTPFSWSVSQGSLPPGLTLSTSGIISGQPTQAGSFPFTVRVADSSSPNQSATAALSITVTTTAPALTITTTALPGGQTSVAYSQTLTASGGTSPYNWSISQGSLPPGLTMNAGGVISGQPTQSVGGNYPFTVRVADSSSPAQSATAALSITITTTVPALTITTAALPGGQTGVAYNQALTASGGTTPYSWSISQGSLPPGLTMNAGGVISGQPTQAGSYPFTVRVADNSSPAQSATAALSITITTTAPVLTITTSALPSGQTGVAYNQILAASGGTTPYSWSVSQGSLPPGLTLSAGGVISGQPTQAGSYPFTMRVSDSSSPVQSVTTSLNISISGSAGEPLKITSVSPLLEGVVGAAYSQPLTASGGIAPFTWWISSFFGGLPNGLILDSATGLISGTPKTAGEYGFTMNVTDSSTPSKQTASGSFSIKVSATPSATVSIVATDSKASESGPKAGILTISRTGNTSAGLRVLYTIAGTAINGTDYQTLPGAVTIPAGASSAIITLMPIDDNLPEGEETAIVTLKPDPAYTVGSPNNAAVTIEDNDQNVVTIVATDPEASETGPKAGVFTVSRTGNTSWALTINLQVGGTATNGIDHNPLPNTITLKVGESSATLTVMPIDDNLYEKDETVIVALKTGNYLMGNPAAAAVTIKDNDPSPVITQVQGKPDTIAPAAQPKAEVLIDKPADQDISGDLVLIFNHNADAALETNPEVRFSNGSPRLHFTIPAQSRQVQFGDNVDGSFQGGTAAGTITLQATMASGWQGPPPPPYQVTIRRAPALITDFTIANRAASSFDLVVTGYSTPRSLRSLTFTFSPSAGNTLNNAVQTLDVNAGAVTWFESDASKQVGGNFRMTIPFTFSGNINAIGAVAVTIVNAEGTSDSSSARF